MTISTAIVISAFFLALSPALYKLAELASEWVKVRRLNVEYRFDAYDKSLNGFYDEFKRYEKEAAKSIDSRLSAHRDRIEQLEEKYIKLNNRVVAGGRKVS